MSGGAPVVLTLASIAFGAMRTDDVMVIMSSGSHLREVNSEVVLDLTKKEVVLTFEVPTPATVRPSTARAFKLQFNMQQMHEAILEYRSNGGVSAIITFDWPPEYSRVVGNDRGHKARCYRQTDVDANPQGRDYPVALQKKDCILDIGRWLTYRMTFDAKVASSNAFDDL